MDLEKERRRQSYKVIVSEAIMTVGVIITVIILAFIVSGYWLNSDFKVERQGMLQIYSAPTGANVDIDGESSWLQRTNMSKVLPNGEHDVVLTKDGYDTWSKTINIKEGLLYRLHYPRLFLNNRAKEYLNTFQGATSATVSPDREHMLVITDADWSLINLDSEKITQKILNVASVIPGYSDSSDENENHFSGEIQSIDWDKEGSHILFKIKEKDVINWILFDVNNVEKSTNLTREFGKAFDTVEIIDNSSNNLVAIQDGNMFKINVADKTISSVLVKGLIDFDHYHNEIVFSALEDEAVENPAYCLGVFKLGDEEIKKISCLEAPFYVTISKFYDEIFISTLEGTKFTLYKKENFEKIYSTEISFAPTAVKVGRDSEFIIMYNGPQLASFDMEAMSISEWAIEGENFGWFDDYMIYSINDAKLIVYDFDGLNRRILAEDASSPYPATVTSDKWLYYFSNNRLVREWLIAR